MRIWFKLPIITGVLAWALASVWAGAATTGEAAAALQAVRQAPDPSAAVAAYANGMAVDRNDPALYDAYVSRMVELGLPEIAFHQAQALTGMQSNNGLAWGVVAYVNARRGEMPEAISAINLAGQFAPTNAFVQRTAGEITAWYDTKADKSKLPDNLKDGLARVRSALEKQPAFADAYTTAQNAYKAQASTPAAPAQGGQSPSYAAAPQAEAAPSEAQPPGESVAPLGYSATAPPPLTYYSDYYYPYSYYPYYYDWGPAWVQPAPWWWWRPVGCFVGLGFVPFSTVVVFDNHDSFHHHHHPHFFAHNRSFAHGQPFFHNQTFHRNGLNVTFRDPDRAFFHRDGGGSFFGTAARPSASLARSLDPAGVRAGTMSGRTVFSPSARGGSLAPSAALPLVDPTGTRVRSYGPSAASAPATSQSTTVRPAVRSGSATMLAPSTGTGTRSGTAAASRSDRITAPRSGTVPTPPQWSSGAASSAATRLRQGTVTSPSLSPSLTAPSPALRSGGAARSSPRITGAAVQTWSGAPRSSWSSPGARSGFGQSFRASPSFSAPRMAPSPAMPSGRGFGGGGFQGGMGGGFRSGGFGGGGVHGGGGGHR